MGETSAARVEANRRNALKSTGPRTAEGKARSRSNAVKHGLSGTGVALLDEDAEAVERRFATLQEEERPVGLMAQLLLHQVALASVRVERAAKLEASTLEPLIRHAAADFERNRLAEVDRLFETIETCPGDHRRRLLAQPEGVDKLVAALESARDQLKRGVYRQWATADKKKVEALFGGTAGQFPATRTDALLIALHGDASYFPEEATVHLKTKEERGAWACAELIVEVEAELARLAEARAAIDLDALEHDRRTAPARAGALPDPGLALARRYAAAASRDFARAYRDHRKAEADRPAEDAEDAPITVPDESNAPQVPITESAPDAPDATAHTDEHEQRERSETEDRLATPAAANPVRVEPNPRPLLRSSSMRFPDDHVPDRIHYGEIRSGSEPRPSLPVYHL